MLLSAIGWGQACVPVATLRPVDTATGSLGDGDCLLSDGSAFAVYMLTLPTFGQLQLNASSNDFPVNLILRDASGRMIAGGSGVQQTAEQLAMLERQYLERRLLEKAGLPRLSLFYMR